MNKSSFYAVAKGLKTGVFTSWSDCKVQIDGFKGARYKKFDSREEAEQFVSQAFKTPPITAIQRLHKSC